MPVVSTYGWYADAFAFLFILVDLLNINDGHGSKQANKREQPMKMKMEINGNYSDVRRRYICYTFCNKYIVIKKHGHHGLWFDWANIWLRCKWCTLVRFFSLSLCSSLFMNDRHRCTLWKTGFNSCSQTPVVVWSSIFFFYSFYSVCDAAFIQYPIWMIIRSRIHFH